MQTENLELKKLVYLYLMNYAKSQPDMAIMAVNTFVKVSHLHSLKWNRRQLCELIYIRGLTYYHTAVNSILAVVYWEFIFDGGDSSEFHSS